MKKPMIIFTLIIAVIGLRLLFDSNKSNKVVNHTGGAILMSDTYDFEFNINHNTKNGTFNPTTKYMKAFFQNKTDKEVTVYIQDGNGITLDNDSFTVLPNEDSCSKLMSVEYSGMEYRYNVISDGGSEKVKGKLIIKTSDIADELK